jgi:plasmid maintenance system antidote protein VapI
VDKLLKLNNLLQNRGKITEALAYLLEEITNIKASFWLDLQVNYNKSKK